ncbi:dihydrolipoamide acetyltransferase family protein [Glutamicibacter ardleyensis]|uniref:Dihydrolipoamide acetyltransferase component of pyruvate dehydrogenase complex n=1 Tax=Glutamicibacter ardleyensis TaxID=225894 RepID=A0ABQ2DIB0_9MICC|nr:dihydrolipoamide acetyltransferase family protein [Glutamicibacter ardleyensis]GGJ56596.1 dihydrolipoamide acetyltransferase component of pyruvate dehydrogenase complex [Glutamicibacter ardleyensis]
MAPNTFKLPDLGEGLTESEVLNWKIQVGEHVALNQIIAEVETAKAVVELPSPFAGIVQKLHASAGEVVPVGGPLVTFGDEAAESDTGNPRGESGDAGSGDRTPTLVGYGAPATSGHRPARRGRASQNQPSATVLPAATPQASAHNSQAEDSGARRTATRSTPPVRKLARDHGIEISSVRGTGADGAVLRADIEALIGAPQQDMQPEPATTGTVAGDRRVKISAVRRATAKAMVDSAFTAPHATEFLTVDLTESMQLVEKLRKHPLLKDVKLNITTLTSLIVTRLLGTYRALNSRWDAANDEIVEFGSVHLGMAVASDRGLLVPVVKDAQSKSLRDLAEELTQIIELGRAGKLSPAQLSGGTFSITNVGVFGVDAGTPILPPGQSGILALGQVKRRPWEFEDQVALRHTSTLALSFDHRVVDGKEASEFLAGIGAVLEDPGMMNIFI